MSHWFNEVVLFLSQHDAFLKLGLIALFGVVLTWVELAIKKRIRPRLVKSKRIWDDSFIDALHPPLLACIWFFVLVTIIPILLYEFGIHSDITVYLGYAKKLSFIAALLWFSMLYIKNIETKIFEDNAYRFGFKDKTSIRAVSQLIRIAIVVVSILVLMNALHIPIATILAAGGIGGIAIGFAAKDTLANFFGGMMIFWDRPFSVGDWIRSPDREIEGTVEYIGWRLTRIRTFDKRPLYVPNGVFSTVSIENPSRMSNRRIKTTIGLRYEDSSKIPVILKDIENMLRHHPEIDSDQTLMVNLFEFGASSLNFFIYTFTKTTDWVKFQAIQQDVFLKVIDIIDKHGAQCAFPSTTVYLPEGFQQVQQSFHQQGEKLANDYQSPID